MASQPLMTCMKGLFLVFNFVFWLTGLALLIVGILSKFAFSYLMKLSTDVNYNLAPYIMIGCGIFILLIGFIGCWAAIKEHGWALKMYIFVLIILFIVEIAGAITGYVLRTKMKSGLKKGLENAVNQYYKANADPDLKTAMDKIQEKYVKCCGVLNYTDYFPKNTGNSTGNTTIIHRVPNSCCRKDVTCHNDDLSKYSDKDKGIYLQGCYNELLDKAKSKFLIVGGVGLGIALFQILGVICAFVLVKQIKNNNYEKM